MYPLSWYREVGGPVTTLRHAEVKVWYQARNIWRTLTGFDGEWDVTGPPYWTKDEAMVAADALIRDFEADDPLHQ